MFMRVLAAISTLLIGGLLIASAQDKSSDTALTVYNAGAALIHEQRTMTFEEGLNAFTLRDVPATIDASSFNFKSLSDPAGTALLERNYRYDSGDAEALLAGFIGETVDISLSNDERYSGELLRAHDNKAVLRTSAREIAFVNLYDIRAIQFPKPPDNLYRGPALQLLLNSANAGTQEVELSYLAGGMSWTADYSVFLNADDSALDLVGLVTLTNRSGRAYTDASLKLVAGEVSRMEPEEADFAEERMMAMSVASDASASVEQRDLSDYKLYAIGRRVTIEEGQTKQIEFVSGGGIAAKISYIFDSSPAFRGYYSPIDYVEAPVEARAKLQTYLEFNTGGGGGLGADLPAGRVRVYKADVDGANLLIGENTINHSPKGEDLRLALGKAFDLTGERIQTDFSYVSRRVLRESFEVRIQNGKDDAAVEVAVAERLYRWRDWQIIESSAPFVKVDAASIEFAITIEPGAEETLTYTVEYSFPEDE